MASSSPSGGDLECPVCSELFQDPKLLPCTHLVCSTCLLTWLNKEGPRAGCPLCRAVVFPTTTGDTHLDAQVEALPTDLAVQSAVDNHSLLHSPDVCGLCDGGKVAASFCCLQCSLKLCRTCGKGHTKIPSCKFHVVEGLSTLTAQRLAEVCYMTCTRHADRLVELYCSAHQELICSLCFPTSHRECVEEVRAIADVAHLKRAELKQMAADLFKEEAQMASQIQASKNDFQALLQKVNAVFDDLEQVLQKRRQAILDRIEMEEKSNRASLSAKEKDRASLKAHAVTISNLAQSAANIALLGMVGKMSSRLTDLKLTRVARNDNSQAMIDVTFDTAELSRLQNIIADLGQIGKRSQKKEPSSSSPPAPATIGATPVTRGATPATTGATPATTGATPVTTWATPATTGAAPATRGATPAAPWATPATTAATPATTGATPATTGATPATTGASRATTGATPATTGASRAPRGASRATRGATPATRGATPATKGASRATTGASRATTGATPATRGATPATIDDYVDYDYDDYHNDYYDDYHDDGNYDDCHDDYYGDY